MRQQPRSEDDDDELGQDRAAVAARPVLDLRQPLVVVLLAFGLTAVLRGDKEGVGGAGHVVVGPAASGAAANGRRRVPWLRVGVVGVALLLAGLALAGSSGQLAQAAEALSSLRTPWVAVAVLAEVAAYLCVGGASAVLLGGRPGVLVATAVAVSAQGAASCLPAGAAVSGVVTYRQLRRWGSSRSRVASAVLLSNLLQAAALPVLVVLGEQLAPDREPIPGLRALSQGLLAAVAVVTVLLVVLRRHHLPSRALETLVALETRIRPRLVRLRHPRSDTAGSQALPAPSVPALRELSAHRVPPRVLLAAAALALGYWLADALSLGFAFVAVRSAVPWGGLLVTYAAAQLASLLPLAPGGLGVVEGSLTIGLVAYGGASSSTLSAVLLYRLISFWGLLPVAAATWTGLKRFGPTGPGPREQQ